MGNVVNLRQARKTKARNAKEKKAAENRAAFGRSKAEKNRDQAVEEKRNTLLDGAEIEDT